VDGFTELTIDKLANREGINELNRMLIKIFDNISGDGDSVRIYKGYGTPEGAVTAGVGSIYMRLDGGTGTSQYRKESGTGATGWVVTSNDGIMVTGAIVMYGGASAPTGYLMCDGAAVSRSTYSALFTAISTTYGVGDNSTTFNLPDMRGVFPKGAGTTNRALGKDANGNYYAGTLGTYETDRSQGHNHNITISGARVYSASSGGSGANNVNNDSGGNNGTLWLNSAPVTDGTNGTPRTGLTTEPQSLGLNFIIKT
jgi:microcystin-dependent protein